MRHKDVPNRSFRRAQKDRITSKIFNRKMKQDYFVTNRSPEEVEKKYRMAVCEATTHKICSNPLCCGNPRRKRSSNCLTLQELKQDNIKDILAEVA